MTPQAKLAPWEHQLEAFDFAMSRDGSLLAMDMGTGKSAVVAWMLAEGVERCLISCPVSVLDVWPRQIQLHSKQDCAVRVLDRRLNVKMRCESARNFLDVRWQVPTVVVVNHEALWREPFGKWALSRLWDLVVIDESHRGSGSPGGKLSRYLGRLGLAARKRVALTGTPLASGIISAYCQGRFVDPRVFGTNASLFRAAYPIENHVSMRIDERGFLRIAAPYEVSEIIQRLPSKKWWDRTRREWVMTQSSDKLIAAALMNLLRQPLVLSEQLRNVCESGDYPEAQRAHKLCRPLHLDEIRQRFAEQMDRFTYRCAARDVLDLPEEIHEVRYCELEPHAMKIYHSLENDLIAELESGEVTASNALVKLLRLQQLTAGFLVSDNGVEEIVSTAKAELLDDVLRDFERHEPVVVFSRFRRDLDKIEEVCAGQRREYGELSGRRRDGLSQGLMSPDIDVLGAQLQAGGVGVDLTRSHYIIDYSPGFSLADYQQSGARQCRPGQKAKSVYRLHLVARGTIDEEVYAALSTKQDAVDAVIKRLGRRS